ncbi:MAG: hypothetical protein U9R04_06455 [Chloroflexota bacterium]|nr:hypothetical protein [Chloroflexota bacterium]
MTLNCSPSKGGGTEVRFLYSLRIVCPLVSLASSGYSSTAVAILMALATAG